MQVKKQQLELDMEQQTGSKSGKELYIVTAYLTYMQSTSHKMLGCMDQSLNKDWQEKYQQPQICR